MIKILAIDDDSDIIDLIRRILPHEDYAVSSAGGSIEAQSKISRQKFDAILLDIGLPGDDGISLLKFLHSIGITKTTPVIMITASPSKDNVLVCRNNGASGFLLKPLKPKTLIDQLARSISMRDIQMQQSSEPGTLKKIRIEKDSLYTLLSVEDRIDHLTLKEAFVKFEEAKINGDQWNDITIDLRLQPDFKPEHKTLLKMLAKLLLPANIYILAGHNYGDLIALFPENEVNLVISEIDLRRQLRQKIKK